MVGSQAFERTTPFLVYRPELTEVARVGFSDLMAIPPAFPWLEQDVARSAAVPVISLPGLVLMKLFAFRALDQPDVEGLLQDDDTRLADVSDYLAEHAPDLLIRLGQVTLG